MKQVAIAGIAGAVVYYVWGMMAWMVLPLHLPTIAGLPNESAITDALKAQSLETGVYVIPWSSDAADMSDPNSTFMKNHASGPIYSIYYQREGAVPMGPSVLLGGFVIDLLAATLAACLLSSAATGCCRSYASRVGFVLGLGIFVGLIGHASYWNWMNFPLGYTLAFVADVVIGWTLAGIVIAAIVRPGACATNKSADVS
jgi:hypothetical protein